MTRVLLFLFVFGSVTHAEIANNLRLGLPSKEGQIINRQGYAFAYSEKHEQALWLTYELTKAEVLNKIAKRKDNFRSDPLIKTGSAKLSDYKESGYDRGHLAPAGDMAWSLKTMSESFYLTNMSPQAPGLNRGMWKNLEELCRKWAITEGSLHIITGPVIREGYKTIGNNKVTVPQWYYKIIVDVNPPTYKAIAFLIPNKKPQAPLQNFAVSIDKLEQVTQLDFLQALDPQLENLLESSVNLNQWQFKTKTIANGKSTTSYWISSSGKRHNSSCRYYENSKGDWGTPTAGKACGICKG